VGIQDAVLAGTTVIEDGTQYMTSTSTSDGLTINCSIDTLSSNVMSISMWFNATEKGGSYYFLATLQTANAPAGSGSRWYMRLEPDGALEIGTDTALFRSTFKPNLNQWYHVVIMSLRNGNAGNMFIDGSFSLSIDGAGYPNFTNVSGFNGVGRNPTNKGLIGRIDEFRHYSRYIQNDEIVALYNYGHL
jgi:hypothetical protein